MAISEASETALKSQLKTAEVGIGKLKDDAARQKVLVAQTRAACANEVRKRERQIEGLKRAVGEGGRVRGVGRGGVVVSVEGVLSGGSPGAGKGDGGDGSFVGGGGGGDGLYDLRSETNAFLAELARGLSEENEGLLGLVRGTMGRLKEMSGMEGGPQEGEGVGVAEMAGEIEGILEHLRTILTNPSFVPIEEVVVREDEIGRLRLGWEKMETRWQEAVHLIDGWKRRMQVSGRAVGIEELKMGLRLSPVRVRDVEETGQGMGMGMGIGKLRLGLEGIVEGLEGELTLVPAGEDDGSDVSSIFEDEVLDDEDDFDVGELDVEEPNVEILEQSVMFEEPPLPEPLQLNPLRDNYAAGNRGGGRKRPGDFTTIIEERTSDLRDEAPMPPPHGHLPQQSPRKKPSRQEIRRVEEEVEAGDGLAVSSSSLDSLLLPVVDSKPAEDVPPPASTHKEQKSPDQPPAAPIHKEQPSSKPKEKPLPKPPVPTKQERPEKERRKPPVPRQPVPARKPLRSNPVRGANKTTERAKESGNGKESPIAPSTRTVSAASAVSIATTADTTVDTSSTSFTSNANLNSNCKEKPTGISTDRDAVMMPPPPLPIPSPSKPDSTSELNKSPKRAGANSRLPLPRPGSNTNLRGDATLHGMGLLPPPQQSPLSMATIQAKLAASEREADAARVRAKLKAVRLGAAQKRGSLVADGEEGSRPGSALSGGAGAGGKDTRRRVEVDEEVDELAVDNHTGGGGSTSKMAASPTKRLTRVRKPLPSREEDMARDGEEEEQVQVQVPVVRKREKRVVGTGSRRASRRRSTLNPWELETLMKGGVEAEGVVE